MKKKEWVAPSLISPRNDDEKDIFLTEVLLPLPFEQTFSYEASVEEPLQTGQCVEVSFGQRTVFGVVWTTPATSSPSSSSAHASEKFTLKPILNILPYRLPETTCLFLKQCAEYTLAPLGLILKMTLGSSAQAALKKSSVNKKISHKTFSLPAEQKQVTFSEMTFSLLPLSDEQSEKAQNLRDICARKEFSPVVLEGLTGSGKTEVYIDAIAMMLAQPDHQIVVLVPEIALTAQVIQRFEKRFGFTPHLWHADISPAQKRDTWLSVLTGKARLIVGARSALFLPYPHLSLIVVDEEHDGSYKQEEGTVRYHARDMAVLRASIEKIPIVLVSATPSLETRKNITLAKYTHLNLTSRFQAILPHLSLIPFVPSPQDPSSVSPLLRDQLSHTLEKGEQSLLFLNRRGYAPFVSCKKCQETLVCPECHVGFVFHKRIHGFLCHYCGKTQSLTTPCPSCGTQEHIVFKGPGVEKVSEEVASFLPQARVQVMSSDHISSPKKLSTLMKALEAREIDVLIGTQMVAKGHHFPYLTCVGVLDADAGAGSLDFRAQERMFQLLIQVSGRAGRAHAPGQVYLQTRAPDSPLLTYFLHGKYEEWLERELKERSEYGWPPEGRLAALIVESPMPDKAQAYLHHLKQRCPSHSQIQVMGPIPAPLFRIKNKYRWRFLIKGPRTILLQSFLRRWLVLCPSPSSVQLIVDIDPYHFL